MKRLFETILGVPFWCTSQVYPKIPFVSLLISIPFTSYFGTKQVYLYPLTAQLNETHPIGGAGELSIAKANPTDHILQ